MTTGNSFDALRLFAALLVVYGHAHPLSGMGSPHVAGNAVQAIGVKIFFVISGYLILGSWQRDPSALRFLFRRALRIMPGLAVVVLASACVLGPLVSTLPSSDYFANARTWDYIANNIAFRPQYDLPGVFAANPYPTAVNGALWSLPAEVAMYLLGPLVCIVGAWALRSARWALALATGLLVLLSMWCVRWAPPAATPVVWGTSVLSFLDVAPYFLLGGLVAAFRWERALHPIVAAAAWFALTLVPLPALVAELALYLVLPYTVLALGLASTRLGSAVHRFGDVSYGVYLYGFPVQQCVAMLVPEVRGQPWLNIAWTLAPLLLLATLSWRCVERPLLRFKPASLQPREPSIP